MLQLNEQSLFILYLVAAEISCNICLRYEEFYSKNVFIMIKVIPVNLIVHQDNNFFFYYFPHSLSCLIKITKITFFLLNT